jgi:hypothetical protein
MRKQILSLSSCVQTRDLRPSSSRQTELSETTGWTAAVRAPLWTEGASVHCARLLSNGYRLQWLSSLLSIRGATSSSLGYAD